MNQKPPNNQPPWQQVPRQTNPNYPPQQQYPPQWQGHQPPPGYHPNPQQSPPPPKLETTVKTYHNPKDFQKDQKHMARQGWTIAHTTEYQPNRSLAGKLFVPFGMITKPPSQIVVTYQRQRK